MAEAVAKKGPELFKELFRIYPVAEVEDYYKNGAWKDDLMRTDLQLVDAHRREAGAPEAPPLEEVKLPEMPRTSTYGGMINGVRAAGAGMVVSAQSTALAGLGASLAELRLIALFVAKWKLEMARTKEILSKITPQRRRYIIQNFKTTLAQDEATDELEKYINECESSDCWAAASAPVPTPVRPASTLLRSMVVPPRTLSASPITGMKRPFSAITTTTSLLDMSKRYRVAPPAATTIRPVRPFSSVNPGSLASRLNSVAPRTVAPVRPIYTPASLSNGFGKPYVAPAANGKGAYGSAGASYGSAAATSWTKPVATIVKPLSAYGPPRPALVRPPASAAGALGRLVRPASYPVARQVAPVSYQPAGKPGGLIRSLLARY